MLLEKDIEVKDNLEFGSILALDRRNTLGYVEVKNTVLNDARWQDRRTKIEVSVETVECYNYMVVILHKL